MAEIETRYRVTFLPDGETPLFGSLDGNGDVVEADFGTPGWSHPRPHLKVPQNALVTETQFVEGDTKIGGFTIELLDPRQTADDQTSGLVTSVIKDVPASEVIVERYFGSLTAWRTVFRGRADRVTIGDSLVTYKVDLLDGRGYESDDLLFSTNETFCLYPDAGPIENYGEIPSSPGNYLLPAVRDALLTVVIPPSALGLISNPDGFGRTWFYFKLNDPSFESTDDARRAAERVQERGKFATVGSRDAFSANQITIRYRPDEGSSWTYIREIFWPDLGVDNAVFSFSGGFTSSPLGVGTRSSSGALLAGGWFDSSEPAPFANGDTLRVQVLARKTTSDTPYIWDGGTVGDLLYEISQGEHTDRVPREKYDATALAAFRDDTPAARFIETSPQKRKAWASENIYKPTLHAPVLTREGAIAPTYWPADEATLAAAPTLQYQSITPIGTWEQEVSRIYNRVEGAYIVETLEEEDEDDTSEETLSAYERLKETEVPILVDRSFRLDFETGEIITLGDESIDLIGPRPLGFNPKTLRVIGFVPGYPPEARYPGSTTAEQLAVDLFEQIGVRFGVRGAPTFEAECRMSDPIVRDAQVGDWFRVEATWTPNYLSGKRNAVRYMQVYGITDPQPAKRILFLLDSGAVAPSDENTFDPENPTTDCLDNATTDESVVSVAPDGRKLLAFTQSGDFSIKNDCGEAIEVQVLQIAGGGGGGGGTTDPGVSAECGGGGAAGGVLGAYSVDDLIDQDQDPITIAINAGVTAPVTVGAGGAGGTSGGDGGDGGDTIIWVDANGDALDPLTDTPVYRAVGGGGGGSATVNSSGRDGGSGGGGGGATSAVLAFTDGGAKFEDQGNVGAGGLASGNAFPSRTTIAGSGGAFGGPGTGAGNTGQGQQQGGDGVFLSLWGITTGWGGGGGYARVVGGGSDDVREGSELNGSGGVWGAGGGGGAAADGQAGRDGLVLVQYKGAAPSLTAPTSSFVVSAVDSRILQITIADADYPAISPAGYRVRVEYAISATEPSASSGLWQLAGYLYEAGYVELPPLPSGTTVWKRTRAEAPLLPSSPWEAAASTTIASVPSLTFAELTRSGATVTFAFTPNAACGGVKVYADRYAVDTTADKTAITERAEIDSTVGTYAVPVPINEGEELRLSAECWTDFFEFDPDSGLVFADDFDRADSGTVGNGWTESGTGATSITSNRAVLEAASATGVRIERADGGADAVFVQATVRVSANAAQAYIYVTDGSDDGYVARIQGQGFNAQGLYRSDSGSLTSLDDTGDDIAAGFDVTVQLYVTDSVQQMYFEDTGGSATASATDANHVGPFEVALRHGSTSGTTNSQFDDVVAVAGKDIVVSELPTGYDVQIVNAGASVVATATESGGTATIDCMRSGDVSENVPVDGWPTIRVRNEFDVVVFTSGTIALYPGASFNWSAENTSLEGVGGTQGDTIPLSIVRPANNGATEDDVGNIANRLVVTQDFQLVVDQNGDAILTNE